MSRFKSLVCRASWMLVALGTVTAKSQVFYVDANVVGGAGDGSTWADAYRSLASAMAVAGRDSQCWVAKGTYKPAPPGGSRAASFVISDNRISIYGGFTNGMSELAERDGVLNPTILSGDLAGNDTANWGNRADNCYSVLRVYSSERSPTGDVIDGFVIRGGNANADDISTFVNSLGGGLNVSNSTSIRIANCVITDNSASGAGGLHLRRSGNAMIENCIFSGNRATLASGHNFGSGAAGLGAQAGAYSVQFIGCRFVGNSSAEYGGAFYSTSVLITNGFKNCLFVGNTASEGGAVHLRVYPSMIVNCTFSENAPSAIWSQGTGSPPMGTNVILWADDTEITGYSPQPQFSYSDIMGSGGAGTSNLDVNPLFVVSTSGTWSATAVYSPASGLTQLTDTKASWQPGVLAGGTVNPDITQNLHYYIATNTTTGLFVWGDASVAANSDTYALHDWHLSTNSPCVDRGNPAMDWSQELDYPSGRIDMGAYGNTREAVSTNPPPVFVQEMPDGLQILLR